MLKTHMRIKVVFMLSLNFLPHQQYCVVAIRMGSFLFYETIAIIGRQQTTAEFPPHGGFGLVLRGLRAMKLVVAAMWTHPVMG